ncbi:secretin N-terminal domain-containing protein [Trinickia diaoshuihuensis]|uniref:secretin N-terminal domain-containing protein n=1 Tax=Trinickia diaoshuihuensis TaxID=2292265 RepID=UPI000E24D966|nr:secretin N-terminal domain-containing protein [Trinickia diaoshuihuensis]
MQLTRPLTRTAAAVMIFATLAGCGLQEVHDTQVALDRDARSQLETVTPTRPIVQVHEGAWLLGEKIRASKPQPEIYDKQVVFKSNDSTTLRDIAAWIADNVGVQAVVDASVESASSFSSGSAAPVLPTPTPTRMLPSPAASLPGGPRLPELPSPNGTNSREAQSAADIARPALRYTGTFRGFLDVVDARYAVWSRYRDGMVTFFKTETRSFTLPSIADVASMSGSISTGDSSGSSSQGSQGAGATLSSAAQAGTSGGTSSGTGGQTITLGVRVSPWEQMEKTAEAVAGPGAQVVADKNLGVLTVTGTPPQCDRVEAWVKNLDAMFGKQVAIDVHVYQVQLSREENYGLNLTLAYQSASGHTGLKVTGAAPPTVTSSSSPMTFGANILSGTMNGTTAAVQALSTLGNVSQLISRSGITQNGKLLALQAAKQQSYVSSTQSTQTASVGSSTTMQTATLVPGFTSSFLPKVINGRILIDFDMTLSDLLSLQTFTSGSGSGQSSVQLPTMQVTRFEQSVSLKPGETLVLTGMRQQQTSSTNNGVGSPYVPIFGGGVDAQKADSIIAVVISARLL